MASAKSRKQLILQQRYAELVSTLAGSIDEVLRGLVSKEVINITDKNNIKKRGMPEDSAEYVLDHYMERFLAAGIDDNLMKLLHVMKEIPPCKPLAVSIEHEIEQDLAGSDTHDDEVEGNITIDELTRRLEILENEQLTQIRLEIEKLREQGVKQIERHVPHKKARGTDICGDVYTTIVRSDLGCYMRCTDLQNGSNIQTHPLHSSCSDGDHYFAYSDREFARVGSDYPIYFIIKGTEYRQVINLSTDAEATTGYLHKFCQGGDFYLAFSKYWAFTIDPVFFILFLEKGVYRVVSNLEMACGSKWSRYDKTEYKLHDRCKGGLYYWAQKTIWSGDIWFYFIKQVDKWGLQFHRTQDLTTDKNGCDIVLHPEVTKFILGGLPVTMGSTFINPSDYVSLLHSDDRKNLTKVKADDHSGDDSTS